MAKRGRPLKYKTVEEMELLIDQYFYDCKEEKKPCSVTGLALALGLDRKGLIEYQGRNDFTNAIKEAKLRVENYLEERLYTSNLATGLIFSLKNNFGWVDKQEMDVNAKIQNKLEDYFK